MSDDRVGAVTGFNSHGGIMAEICSFHRTVAAHFQCQECGTSFCDECVSVRETMEYSGKNRHYFCPACNLPLKMLSIGNMIEPFWQRLSAIFLYPLQPTPLLATLVLAGLGTLFPASFLVQIVVWVVMMKYAYAVLITTGRGGLRAPAVTWDLINQDVGQVFKQYVLFAILGICASMLFDNVGLVGGFAFIILIALAMPAIIMLLVATNSVLHALNPLLFIPVITRIGWPYLLMYLFLAFLLSGPAALFSYLPMDRLPQQISVFIYLFLQQSYTLICYHLMGYVLLQFHDVIGYPVDYDFFMGNRGVKRNKTLSPQEELRNGLAVLIKMGRYKEALERLLPHVREENADPDLSEKFLQLLRLAGEQKEASAYAKRHLDLLVQAKKKEKALALYAEIKNDEAALPSPESVFAVATWHQERNEYKKAMEAYAYFLKNYKNHALRPDAYFQLARLLHEQGRNTEKAREILHAIVKHYPNHNMTAEAREYLAFVA
jgi:tetratricopeptide (TPR) repeat protein